jgi:hypothetical protein
VLEKCPAYTDTSSKTATPLADSSINDRLVKARPLVDQTRFEFIDVGYSGAVNLLMQHTPYAVVDWVKIR